MTPPPDPDARAQPNHRLLAQIDAMRAAGQLHRLDWDILRGYVVMALRDAASALEAQEKEKEETRMGDLTPIETPQPASTPTCPMCASLGSAHAPEETNWKSCEKHQEVAVPESEGRGGEIPLMPLPGAAAPVLKATEFAWPQDASGLIAMAEEWGAPEDADGDHDAADVLIVKLGNALRSALEAQDAAPAVTAPSDTTVTSRHGGNIVRTPFYLYPWQCDPEYDQGHSVIVWYDDLVLKQEDLAKAEASLTSQAEALKEAQKNAEFLDCQRSMLVDQVEAQAEVIATLTARASTLEDAAFHFQTCRICRADGEFGRRTCINGQAFDAFLRGEKP